MAHPRPAAPGDGFAVPAGVRFANVYSVGDLSIMFGAALLAYRTTRRFPVSAG